MTETLIIHHANCPDGFGSAWLLHDHLRGASPRIVAANYGDPLPDNVDGANVIVADFCYESDQLAELAERAGDVLILDHHQTAAGYLADSPFDIFSSVDDLLDQPPTLGPVAVLDQSHSGVGIVMQWTGREPEFLYYIEDRDLWRFDLPNTADVFAAVTSHPYTLAAWDQIAATPLPELLTEGRAINRYREQLIAQTLEVARQEFLPTGYEVWVAPSPYAIGSDVAGRLAERDPERHAAYYIDYGDRVRYGLRSGPEGHDVAKIAETMGGGGHFHAAGFEVVTNG